ncbi:unnamed protein product [Linum trigynum]|uniref:Uncharacterized protein n=1 Tax=Linum trigynum TaxID=586398 RepID=A0AAV2EZ01_9ROSI
METRSIQIEFLTGHRRLSPKSNSKSQLPLPSFTQSPKFDPIAFFVAPSLPSSSATSATPSHFLYLQLKSHPID